MAHFAKIDSNNIVTQVIVAEQEFIDSGAVGDPASWIQTSYNTYGGQHRLGGTPLRKNYAGIGYTYRSDIDAFVPPQPFASWLLNNQTGLWDPPTPMPSDAGQGDPPKTYRWDENTTTWIDSTPVPE